MLPPGDGACPLAAESRLRLSVRFRLAQPFGSLGFAGERFPCSFGPLATLAHMGERCSLGISVRFGGAGA